MDETIASAHLHLLRLVDCLVGSGPDAGFVAWGGASGWAGGNGASSTSPPTLYAIRTLGSCISRNCTRWMYR